MRRTRAYSWATGGAAGSAIVGDVDLNAYIASVVNAGGTVSPGRRVILGNLIASLKSTNVWPKMARLWTIGAENIQSSTIDLVVRASYAVVGPATVFTVDRGQLTDGVSNYLQMDAVDTSKYTLNSADFGFSLRTNIAAINSVVMGTSNTASANSAALTLKWGDGNLYMAMNDANNFPGVVGPVDTRGIWTVTRTGPTTAGIYNAGALFAASTEPSTVVPSFPFALGAGVNSAGGSSFYVAGEFSTMFMGAGLTGADVANLHSALQTYLTAIGA